MSPALSQEISRLTPGERLELIGQIWDTLENQTPLNAEQEAELDHRLEILNEDRAHAVPWSVVKAELTARLQS